MSEIIFENDEDWEKRVLCSDESCIGTIGPDGTCRECGKVYEGKFTGQQTGSVQPEMSEEQQTVQSADTASDEDWEKRILCGDESCIGVIGSDGKCRECGKPL